MKIYFADLIPKIKKFSKRLDDLTLLMNQHWISLDEINEKIDCIDIVVNPKIAMMVIDEAVKNGIKYLWFQPGTWDDEVIKKALDNNLNIVYGHCVYAILGMEE